MYLDSGTLTPLLKRIQTAGLIVRERSIQDERKVIITLTEAGLKLRDKAQSIPESMQKDICISSEEFNDLLTQFNHLLERVHETNRKHK